MRRYWRILRNAEIWQQTVEHYESSNDRNDRRLRQRTDNMEKQYYSAPGRVEICGNHTDHQNGMVLAAAVNLETKCYAVRNDTDTIHIESEGFGAFEVDLSDTGSRDDEKGSTAALVRGVAEWFKRHGYAIGGFDAEVKSEIPVGAGLSSSAAFEVLVGNIFNGLFGSGASRLDVALAGQFAENVYFGKPCGLMDQAASSYGGMLAIDFEDPLRPSVTEIDVDFQGYSICVVATGSSHEELTDEYSAIRIEMESIAKHYGESSLRTVSEADFYDAVESLRYLGDRAILRAMHYFDENTRVKKAATALDKGDIKEFLSCIVESGRSSVALLQNIYSPAMTQQGISLALALSERQLRGKGAWRVLGGGFAGSILAFVPDDKKEEYGRVMRTVFGEDSCHFLKVSTNP